MEYSWERSHEFVATILAFIDVVKTNLGALP